MEYYLIHSGRSKLNGAKVGSGRYPLGSGARPYQDYPSRQKLTRKQKKVVKLKAKQEAVERKKLTDEEKRDIIERGDVKNAFKNVDDFSNEDIDAVIKRWDAKNKLSSYAMKGVKTGKQKFDELTNNLDRFQKFGNNATKVYDVIAKTINTFGGTTLPLINNNGGGGGGNNNNNNNNNVEDIIKKVLKEAAKQDKSGKQKPGKQEKPTDQQTKDGEKKK